MTFIVTEGARQTCNHRVVGGQRLLIELLLVDFARAHDVDQLRVKPVGVLVWLLLRELLLLQVSLGELAELRVNTALPRVQAKTMRGRVNTVV